VQPAARARLVEGREFDGGQWLSLRSHLSNTRASRCDGC